MKCDRHGFNRRTFLRGAGATAAAVGVELWAGGLRGLEAASSAALPPMPSRPLQLTIIDVAGQLQLTKSIIEDYARSHGQYVSGVSYQQATAPELPAKIKAQQAANQLQINMVLTGSDALSAGIVQDIWQRLLPDFQQKFPNLIGNYQQPKAQGLAQGFGILDVFGNYGPTFTYNPAKLPTPPKTPDDLLAWAKANPGQLIYARPANSGPGRSLLMGLPYLLGEAQPREPQSWTKVWPYYQQLGQYIQYYPTGTAGTYQELGQGARTIAASTMGWDLNVRALGVVPKNFGAFVFDNEHLIADTQYICVPKGNSPEMLGLVLDVIAWTLRPDQQAKVYDTGYFYPGPAIKGVTLAMAPKDSQDAVGPVRRQSFDDLIRSRPVEIPLDPDKLVQAFTIWDQKVGANKLK
ncbi:MAG TPA: extracellular solute-binding protein [bacterium]|nr:extracellular solute-binding protein [bacterium]